MSTTTDKSLLQGNILKSLISFAFPVLLALFLQAMYGAADLIIVGQFADTCEQSCVASGSQFFNMITLVITGRKSRESRAGNRYRHRYFCCTGSFGDCSGSSIQ